MSVDSLGLPKMITEGLKKRGIIYLTPPQTAAIRAGLLRGKNLVVSAPTASGKTLIAELALLNWWLKGHKGVYATPLKTLASEKAMEFKYWESLGLKVGLTTGDFDEPGEWLGQYDIVVATYERLDSIFRLKPSWISNVGVVVIDEFHMVGDYERGPIVEFLTVRALRLGAQLIGLSATIGNPDELSEWVKAELVTSDWRPVKLIEGYYSKYSKTIEFMDGRSEPVKGPVPHHVARETFRNGYQSLIFVHSRHKAEKLARTLAVRFGAPTLTTHDIVSQLEKSEAPRIEKNNLKDLVQRGVAFHHAGLSHASRSIIENAFREGTLKIVVATPTLAAGINLPARRVLVYTKRYEGGYMRPISVAEYKQMAGRAGRPQYDPFGEAIIADAPTTEYALKFIRGEPENVRSSLISERALRIHILSLIASGDASTIEELMRIMRKTLAFKQLGPEAGENATEYTVSRLGGMGMIILNGRKVRPSRLGSYVSRLYIDPLTAVTVLENLKEKESVKPIYYFTLIAMTPDFTKVRIVKYRDLEEEAAIALDQGEIPEPVEGADYYDWLKAFKIGKILNAWIEEVSEDEIIERYDVGAGDLRNIVETAEWLLYASSRVCEATKMKEHASELRILTLRVRHGIKEELLDLVRVRGIGRVRARILYSRGIKSLAQLAQISPAVLASLPTFGRKTAEDVIAAAKELLRRKT